MSLEISDATIMSLDPEITALGSLQSKDLDQESFDSLWDNAITNCNPYKVELLLRLRASNGLLAIPRKQLSKSLLNVALSSNQEGAGRIRTATLLLCNGAEVAEEDSKGRTALFYFLDVPDLVRAMAGAQADVNHKDHEGITPLHEIASWSQPELECAEIILHNGGAIDEQDLQGRTPLFNAVYYGESANTVSWLLRHHAAPDVASFYTPLQAASYWAQVEIVSLLLRAGANVNYSHPQSPRPPLVQVMGARCHLNETVDLLLSFGADPVGQGYGDETPLAAAVRQSQSDIPGQMDVIQKLYNHAQLRGTPYTAEQLNQALSQCRHGYDREIFEQFLVWNPDANQRLADARGHFTRPLLLACRDDQVPIDAIEHLILNGADPTLTDHFGVTPLQASAQAGASEIVHYLLGIIDPELVDQQNQLGQTALHLACKHISPNGLDSEKRRQVFLDTDVSLDPSNERDLALFHRATIQDREMRASYNGYLETVQYLLNQGASPVVRDAIGATPMHYACKVGEIELVDILHRAPEGRYILKDKNGQTPLHWAAKHGSAIVVEAIAYHPMFWSMTDTSPETIIYGEISRRQLPMMSDKEGRTPVHLAAMESHISVVRVLLQRQDVCVDSRDRYGRSALDYAEARGHFECAAELREATRRRRILTGHHRISGKGGRLQWAYLLASLFVILLSIWLGFKKW